MCTYYKNMNIQKIKLINNLIKEKNESIFNENKLLYFDKKNKYDETALLNTYPSDFFNKWIKNFGITKCLLKKIISLIKTKQSKWRYLLYNLIDSNNISQHKDDLFIICSKNKLFDVINYALLFNIKPSNDIFISFITDNNVLNNLEKKGFRVNDQLNLLILNGTNKNKIFELLDKEPKNIKTKLISKMTGNFINDILEKYKNNINLNDLMDYACLDRNLNLIKFLININVKMNNNHILQLLNLTDTLNKTPRYNLKYCNEIADILKILKDKQNDIKITLLSNSKNNKIYMNHLANFGYCKLFIYLASFYDIPFKINFNKSQFIIDIIAHDNVELLKLFLKLGIVKSENFQRSKYYLPLTLFLNAMNVAKYLLNNLNMKLKFYWFYFHYRIPFNLYNMISFIKDNNIDSYDDYLVGLSLQMNDIVSLKLLCDIYDVKITNKRIMKSYDTTLKPNIVKYLLQKHTINENLIISLLKNHYRDTHSNKHTQMIKILTKNIKLTKIELIKFAINLADTDLIEYFTSNIKNKYIPSMTDIFNVLQLTHYYLYNSSYKNEMFDKNGDNKIISTIYLLIKYNNNLLNEIKILPNQRKYFYLQRYINFYHDDHEIIKSNIIKFCELFGIKSLPTNIVLHLCTNVKNKYNSLLLLDILNIKITTKTTKDLILIFKLDDNLINILKKRNLNVKKIIDVIFVYKLLQSIKCYSYYNENFVITLYKLYNDYNFVPTPYIYNILLSFKKQGMYFNNENLIYCLKITSFKQPKITIETYNKFLEIFSKLKTNNFNRFIDIHFKKINKYILTDTEKEFDEQYNIQQNIDLDGELDHFDNDFNNDIDIDNDIHYNIEYINDDFEFVLIN